MKLIHNECNVRGLLIEYDAGYLSPEINGKFINEIKNSIQNKTFDLKNPVVYAVLQKYGVRNKNGRIYPEAILRREAKNYEKLIQMGASSGETDHAQDAVISIKNTSLLITKLWWEGISLMGEIYLPITRGYIEMGIISHPADKIAHDIINGFQYGVSSRGVGSIKSQGDANIVQEDFELICWDFVTMPSTHGSWVYPDKGETIQHIEYEISKENQNKEPLIVDKQKNTGKSLDDRLLQFMKNFK